MSMIERGRSGLCIVVLASSVCSVGVVGCGNEEDLSREAQEQDEPEPQALFQQASQQSNAQVFSWSKGKPDQEMVPVASHLCFLTRVSGQLGGPSTSVAMHHSQTNLSDFRGPSLLPLDANGNVLEDGPVWKIAGSSGDKNSLQAEATCVPRADFRLGAGMVMWDSGNVVGTAFPTNTVSKDLWLGDAIAHVDLVQGWFEGGGEFAQIEPGAPNTTTHLSVRTQNSSQTSGMARSLFLGIPGATATRRTPQVQSSGNKKQLILPTRDGVCYLTRISGDFNGSEERIRIAPIVDGQGTEWWQLETHNGGDNVYATAECVLYDQT
jgi:hypothetical protein